MRKETYIVSNCLMNVSIETLGAYGKRDEEGCEVQVGPGLLDPLQGLHIFPKFLRLSYTRNLS